MKKILVTAGPTREHIDPVRFISNYSTGKFGYEIAREARRRGCRVTLISGPTALRAPSGVKIIRVETALEMKEAVKKLSKDADCIIMAAAVCDWKIKKPHQKKIKKSGSSIDLELEENPDILKELGREKKYVLVGFALETETLEKNAAKKLRDKNIDIIVANKLADNNLFGSNNIDIIIMDRFGRKARFRKKSKKALAKIILDKALNFTI